MVNIRAIAIGKMTKPELPVFKERKSGMSLESKSTRDLYFDGVEISTNIYGVEDLCSGDSMKVPCVIEDPRSTIVVLPEQKVSVDKYRNFIIE